MLVFKPKSNKKFKYNKKSAVTLDLKHKEILNELSKEENDVIKYKKEIVLLKKQLKHDLSIEEHLDVTDRIYELNRLIKEITHKKKDYLLDNSKYIFEYFENKKDISTGIKNAQPANKSKLINNFFKIKNEENQTDADDYNLFQKDNNNIVLKYLSNVSDEFLDTNNFVYPTDICIVCHKGEMVPLEEEGLMICNTCCRSIPYLIENDKPTYKEPPKEVCFYAYKRINHFKEILAQFQGKETTQIPLDVIEKIKQQIKKERITTDQITNTKLKEILKKLDKSKYYEHIPFIKDKLGIKPPVMSPELEDTLCNLFIETQAPYLKFCPLDRVNFLNYYYTAYKLCELLGETQYLKDFPMLKDPEKRMQQDVIWKKICIELDWEFIPTI